ncbi:hypothetical protein B0181_03165 [Moraxella caviae]|uniref:MAPEG family n=1 Tax=Moraxella caviae TaxID=34060 RepID=A0A1T0A6N8_9GAMM|nr:MAPEG family protein [Moraxella caviae]OOR91320.1 hypothetical protein B0181_03165 [Moraxella caviae]STZ13926.1 MAPEG family [Moraxella caviae]
MSWVAAFSPDISLAVYAMLAACIQPLLWALLAKVAGGFRWQDNENPREFLAKTNGMAARLNAAQANTFEGLPIFLAAVMVAMYCFVPQNVVNAFAWLYVLLRTAYAACYALNFATLRSVVWLLGMMICVALFVFAAMLV